MSHTISSFEDFKVFEGQEIGVSEWLEVTQEQIDQFADATNDHQWIHVDVDRAKKEMPGSKTIAHGYLTLSETSEFLYKTTDYYAPEKEQICEKIYLSFFIFNFQKDYKCGEKSASALSKKLKDKKVKCILEKNGEEI